VLLLSELGENCRNHLGSRFNGFPGRLLKWFDGRTIVPLAHVAEAGFSGIGTPTLRSGDILDALD
jgi:hypothetical protein